MTTRTWSGASGSYTDATQWSGGVVPTSGDNAIINSGTVTASGQSLTGLQINLNSSSSSGGTFVLDGDTLAASTLLSVTDSNTFGSSPAPVLTFNGTTTNNGTISFSGTTPQVTFNSGATLVNNGTLTLNGASPQVQIASGSTPGAITNNGLIQVLNPSTIYQSAIVNATISGTGTISVGNSGAISFRQSIGAGQVLAFGNSPTANSAVEIDTPNSFGATVSGFVQSDRLILTSIPYTSFTYASTGSASGTLSLLNGSTVQSSINLSGIYSQNDFTISASPLGVGGLNNITVTTGVTNSATGAGSVGTNPGGSGNTVGAVYRFFDNKFGTHFFTSDVGERNTVLATRSADLIQETNGFGDVAQNSTSAVAVYRFFDTNFGTHFFTANAGERDTIINTRPDLTYEANSTFYEHSSLQAGDTAVYRLFDTKTGTQFLTGDTNEYAGLTTAGSSTYRADLRSEGVAFYAPTGKFT